MVYSSVQKWRYPVMTNVRNANGFFYDRAARGAGSKLAASRRPTAPRIAWPRW